MKNILVYDDTEKELEEIAMQYDVTVAEIVDCLMEYIEEVKQDISK